MNQPLNPEDFQDDSFEEEIPTPEEEQLILKSFGLI